MPELKIQLESFLAEGAHGDMTWLASNTARRAAPSMLWPQVRSIVMLGMNYGPESDPLTILKAPDRAAISVYAKGDDYHGLIKGRLKELAHWLTVNAGGDVKVFVDTAAVMEKPLAARAGLGWQGKHTNLVSRQYGSWLLLGSIFTTLDLPSDPPEPDSCGTCRACLDICPTAAIPAPYKLDARRCISYLTIEKRGDIVSSPSVPKSTEHLCRSGAYKAGRIGKMAGCSRSCSQIPTAQREVEPGTLALLASGLLGVAVVPYVLGWLMAAIKDQARRHYQYLPDRRVR